MAHLLGGGQPSGNPVVDEARLRGEHVLFMGDLVLKRQGDQGVGDDPARDDRDREQGKGAARCEWPNQLSSPTVTALCTTMRVALGLRRDGVTKGVVTHGGPS